MAKPNPKGRAKKPRKTLASSTAKRAKQMVRPDAAGRQQMIAEAAYYIAEERNFTAGNEVADWLQAERDIDARLAAQ